MARIENISMLGAYVHIFFVIVAVPIRDTGYITDII